MSWAAYLRAIGAAALAALPVVACSAKSSGPSTWSYTVDFGSVAAAVSVDTIQVDVFDGTIPTAKCDVLVQARRTKADLPKSVLTLSSSVCDFASGKGVATIPFGTYTVLVVAKQKGQDWLIGCNTQYVTRDEDPGTLPVSLTNFADNVIVAATACQTLTAHCQNGC